MTDYLQNKIISSFDRISGKSRRVFSNVLIACVRRIPYRIRYWVIILAWADATQGQWSDQEVPGVYAHQLLERMK
jgi:hypothetical protein